MKRHVGCSMRDRRGFTVVELLITAAVMVVILAVLTSFFATQTQVSTSVQERNQVENKLKTVAELVMQDVQQAGSVAIYASGIPTYAVDELGPGCSRSERHGCVVTSGDGNVVTTLYMTSLVRPVGGSWATGGAAACRRVDYDITDGVFSRRDVPCSSSPTGFEGFDLASGITDVTVHFVCGIAADPVAGTPGDPFSDPSLCYAAGRYPREAVVSVTGVSEGSRDPIMSTVRLSTPVPNLRPPVVYDVE